MNKLSKLGLMSLLGCLLLTSVSFAANVSIVVGSVGDDAQRMRKQLDIWEKETGHTTSITAMPASTTDQFAQYKIWLSAKNSDIDLYNVDVIWAPQIDQHLVDLTPHTKDIVSKHFPSIIESQTVNGRLVAIPAFTDAPALYYRKDLLAKYNEKVPTTWKAMTATAKRIQAAERKAGNSKMWGFVWQGNAYEGLTCDALEWVKSHGGGQIVEANGSISINNKNTVAALNLAKSWVGTISPPGVLAYGEEESRGVWQSGNAVFMRNWPYAYSLGRDTADSGVKGKFDVTTLPHGANGKSAATLGGWNIAVSKYSKNQDAAISLVRFLASERIQKMNAIEGSKLPTIVSLYKDKDVLAKNPFFANWQDVFLNAVPRPSASTKRNYNEVSKEFYTAVHKTLSGNGTAEKNLADLESRLKRLKGKDW